MPSAPYAKLRVAVNGGAPQTGGITIQAGDTIAFSFEDTSGWQQYRISMAGPPGWTGPGGAWVSSGGLYVYSGVVGPPASWTAPTIAYWGKFMPTLVVNDGYKHGASSPDLTDSATAMSMLSTYGIEDIGYNETTQFGGAGRGWLATIQSVLRHIDRAKAGLSVTETLVTLPTSGSADTTLYTVPATPSGNGRFILTAIYGRLERQLVGAGSDAFTIGATAGGNEYMTSKTINSSTALGTVYGNLVADFGASMDSARGYTALLNAGANIILRGTATGTVTTAPQVRVSVYGLHLP